ncbi:hypothetical protein VO01_05800 [Clavibacter michiganensis subsp. insidiosus]|nr:hypothetical protein VO01_05800 [Clavibacter michiganensis subsp. insidiosus]AWG01154.1 hypothetical protein BEH62_06035 [Clavibacter michiganensis subsp. insidiosus]
MRPVIKTLIRVSDLDYAFDSAAHEEHVRKIHEAAPPLTVEQVTVIGEVLQNHLRDRDAERRRPGGAGSSA